MSQIGESNKKKDHIGYRVRCRLHDGRELVGTFNAFDKYMNVILVDCGEFRRAEKRRNMGVVLIRGSSLISMTLETT